MWKATSHVNCQHMKLLHAVVKNANSLSVPDLQMHTPCGPDPYFFHFRLIYNTLIWVSYEILLDCEAQSETKNLALNITKNNLELCSRFSSVSTKSRL